MAKRREKKVLVKNFTIMQVSTRFGRNNEPVTLSCQI